MRINSKKIVISKTDKKNNFNKIIYKINTKAGRNNEGSITVRHRGGGHKRLYRKIDFKRDLYNINGIVNKIAYDPNRTSNIALINYLDIFNRYIICPTDLVENNTVKYTKNISTNVGDTTSIGNVPYATLIHNIEIKEGKGAQLARAAGAYGQVLKKLDEKSVLVELNGKNKYPIGINNKVTIGQVSNIEFAHKKLRKAGQSRWLGIRPTVRGVAMNPVDHPHGGGEGKTSGGRLSVSPKGKLTKGKKTVKRKKIIY